jgi:hypothetical protein
MKVLSAKKIRKQVVVAFLFLATSCAATPNGLRCYEQNSEKDAKFDNEKRVFSILISNSGKTGFVKWDGKGAGDEWEKVDILATPDAIKFNQDLSSVEISTKIDRTTLYSKSIAGGIEELSINSICRNEFIELPKQRI